MIYQPLSPDQSNSIYNLDFDTLKKQISLLGEPDFRAKQIWSGLYQQLWNTPEQFSNLSLTTRQMLSENFVFNSLTPIRNLISVDGNTSKFLFSLRDGTSIETVLMRYEQRNTVCVSSQVGCPMGCVFCATGQMGYKRNLSRGEIVEQILYFARELSKERAVLSNVVIMGMGEPFLNYDETMAAIMCLNNETGFKMGERRFTISTVGIIPAIYKFADEKHQINLAISLHAANNDLRSKLLPINRKYPLADLIKACQYYCNKTRRRLTFEWALIQDLNDKIDHAQELARLLEGMLCHVNIIPLNPTQVYSGKPSTRGTAEAFKNELEKNHIPCTIRLRRGIEIQAGCGQLASNL
jgi:23S rRNA (adenine2503-C2)-methyltransferase